MAFTYVGRLAAGNRLTVGELAAAAQPEHAAGAPDHLSREFREL
jgi:hypothetical protein